MTINWRRGMFRLWLLSSAVWLGAGLVWLNLVVWHDALELAAWVGPPLAALGGYFGARWIALGFHGREVG